MTYVPVVPFGWAPVKRPLSGGHRRILAGLLRGERPLTWRAGPRPAEVL